ncbi:hypothetical protein L1887_06097 [Cichorium endivia]|nr:hypothetical protein L1887_06097 [Cichorium endivia]
MMSAGGSTIQITESGQIANRALVSAFIQITESGQIANRALVSAFIQTCNRERVMTYKLTLSEQPADTILTESANRRCSDSWTWATTSMARTKSEMIGRNPTLCVLEFS